MAHGEKTSAPRATRIVLVDDHPMVRERIAEIVSRESGLTICGGADDRHEALALIEAQKPDLAVIDLTLKNSDGMELIKDIRSRWPKLLILVVSMHDETLYAERVLRAGAQGYITKQEATSNILQAIRRVLNGGIYLNEKTASTVLARLASREGGGGSIRDLLAERELQVFEFTGRGLNTREIAEQLHIDVKTVETYRARIKEKLNLKSGSELLQLAIRWSQTPRGS
jgi:DNA-binding NarL/FixJ family response regulator